MKKLQALLFLLTLATASYGQIFKRAAGESKEDFAARCKPADTAEITGNVLETKLWDGNRNMIFAFYMVTRTEHNGTKSWTEPYVEGYVFVPRADGAYQRVFIDRYGQEGADAEIRSVFFANADKDAQKELVILCAWDQSRHYGISGALYQAYIYDDIKEGNKTEALHALTGFEKIFDMEFDGTNDAGEASKAHFTTAGDIRKKLKQLGY